MLPIEEYLERRGAKYFVTVLMLFYVLGTVIFNVYLRSIGLYEFALLQLRYMFIGFTFGIITVTVPLSLLLIKRFIWGRGEDWTKKEKKEREQIQNKIEKIVLVIFIPWIFVYALYVFPIISPGFGGGKPIEARLVGDADQIRKVNAIIARETGVEGSTLPYELLDEESGLAVGTNVQILDQSKDRYLLLLTKDLYLSSQSQVAKKLIEGGDGESIDIAETKNFRNKPLPISSEGIETITLDLYEPPSILTKTDLEVAAATIATKETSTKAVTDVLTEVQPEVAAEVLVAVQKTVEEVKRSTPTQPTKTTFTINNAPDPEVVGNALEIQYDTTWLDVRSTLFAGSTRLQGIERSGMNAVERTALVQNITDLLQQHYPEKYGSVDTSENGYLSVGKTYDSEFGATITKALRGAENVDAFLERINALSFQAPERKPFETIQSDVVSFFDQSVLEQDTATNRNYIQQKVTSYLEKEAPEQVFIWKDTDYIVEGVVEEGYSANLKQAFENALSWNDLEGKLVDLYADFASPSEPPPIDQTPPTEPVEDETNLSEDPVLPVENTSETSDPVVEEPATTESTTEESSTEPQTTGSEETPSTDPDSAPAPAEENPVQETQETVVTESETDVSASQETTTESLIEETPVAAE